MKKFEKIVVALLVAIAIATAVIAVEVVTMANRGFEVEYLEDVE